MKPPFVLTPSAEHDLNEIWEYITKDRTETADRVLKALETAMRTIAQTPGIGHLREELADRRHRFFLVYSYLIVYRHETRPLEVIRVLHAARDVQSILNLDSEG